MEAGQITYYWLGYSVASGSLLVGLCEKSIGVCCTLVFEKF
jgi:hypothetical protein